MPARKSSRRKVAKWQRRRDVHSKNLKNPFFQKKVSVISYFPTTIIIYVLIIINVFLLTHLFFYSHYFKIHEVYVEGVKLEMTEIIRNKTFDQLNEKRWILFPQHNRFVFDKHGLKEKILDLVNYQKITITIKDHRLLISLHEEQGILNWVHHSGTFVVNNQGVALYNVREFEPRIESLEEGGNKFLISFLIGRDNNLLIYDNTRHNIDIGDTVADSEYVSRLLFLDDYFTRQIETTIVSYEIFNTIRSHIKIHTYQGWYLLINNDSKEQIEEDILRLKIVLDEKFKDDRTRIEYVDLRNGEKVFYK